MTPATLSRVGTALYGGFWQTQLADDLGVNPRTLRRWLSQELPIPDLRAELREIVRDRAQALIETLEYLD
jgi:transposase-like protein